MFTLHRRRLISKMKTAGRGNRRENSRKESERSKLKKGKRLRGAKRKRTNVEKRLVPTV